MVNKSDKIGEGDTQFCRKHKARGVYSGMAGKGARTQQEKIEIKCHTGLGIDSKMWVKQRARSYSWH